MTKYLGALPFFALIGIAILFIGIAAGKDLATREWHKEAVEAGHAEYVLDPKDGTVFWRWKEEKE